MIPHVTQVYKARYLGRHDPPARWGHTCMLGKSGYGKGTTGQMLCENYFDEGYKVIIWTYSRSEMTAMQFPEDESEMLRLLHENRLAPKGFKTEVLLPVFQREVSAKVKVEVPETWMPVKLKYEDLTKTDLLFLMGGITENAERILNVINFSDFKSLAQLQRKILQLGGKPPQDVLYLVDENNKNPTDIGDSKIYRAMSRAIGALIKKNMVVSKLPIGFNWIDLEKIQRENGTITVFAGNATWSEENFMTIFINVMYRLLEYRHQHSGQMPPLVVYVPEISNYSGAEKLLQQLFQEARDAGISLLIDTQRPQNITRPVAAQITRWYLFNMNPDDRDYVSHNLREITKEYATYESIPNLERGICVQYYQTKQYRWEYRKACMIHPPRSHKKIAYEDINDYFKRHGVNTKTIEDVPQSEIKAAYRSQIQPEEEGSEEKSKSKHLNFVRAVVSFLEAHPDYTARPVDAFYAIEAHAKLHGINTKPKHYPHNGPQFGLWLGQISPELEKIGWEFAFRNKSYHFYSISKKPVKPLNVEESDNSVALAEGAISGKVIDTTIEEIEWKEDNEKV